MPTILVSSRTSRRSWSCSKVNLVDAGYDVQRGARRRDRADAAERGAARPAAARLDAPRAVGSCLREAAARRRAHEGAAGHHGHGAHRRGGSRRRPRSLGRRLRDQAVLAARTEGQDQVGAAPSRAGSGAGVAGRRLARPRPGDASRVGRPGSRSRWARRNSGCCGSSWRGPSASIRAPSCSTRYGAITSTSRSARSTCTSAGCGWRSSRSDRTGLIETVRGSGYRLAVPR